MPTHLAVAITAPDTANALASARSAVGLATLVEYRLDLMGDFDLSTLLVHSPLPAIITCRSRAQGGQFPGPEHERRAILQAAIAAGAAFVDIEIEALPVLSGYAHPRTQIIGSLHDFGAMPDDWASLGRQLVVAGADIPKLAGMAHNSEDVLTPLGWLAELHGPGIGIAMGKHGVASRLLAPRFKHAFLSFAALEQGTAPGQISASEMVQRYHFHRLAAADPCFVVLAPTPVPWALIESYQTALGQRIGPDALLLPLPTSTLTPGLLLALQLANIRGILCLPGVELTPGLRPHGIPSTVAALRLDQQPYPALAGALPDPADLCNFWLM